MKILLATGIYPPDAGGPATYTRAVARALFGLGHEVQVVAYGERDAVDSADGFPIERIVRGRNVVARYWRYANAVRRRARLADVVYLQGPVSEGFPGMIGAMLAGKPVVMKVVGDYAWEVYANKNERPSSVDEFLMHRHSGTVRVLEWIERWTARRAKRVIVPSRYLASVVKAWGVPDERVRVIYNAAEGLPAGRSRAEVRDILGVADKRIMLTAVRAVPWKNVDFIIDLMSEFAEDVIFVVAGDGPSLAAWQKRAADLGVGDRVIFTGRLDRATLANWYRAADLFVLPSGYEGFPHVVPEAASVGLPSLVSDQGGNPETRELLGGGLVRVLPYLDREVWRAALLGPWPERTKTVAPDALRFETMAVRTIDALKESL